MSNLVLPVLPGIKWSTFRSPEFDNITKDTDSGRTFTRVKWSSPRWHYRREYEFLRADANQELQTLVGFFLKHYGNGLTWLFDDPDDNTATGQQFGTGDGVTTQFQLVRSLGGFSEAIYELNGAPTVKVNGVVTAVTSDVHTGLVTFSSAPAAGATLTWSGQYYWRCRFKKSMQEFEQFMSKLWSAKSIEFRTEKP